MFEREICVRHDFEKRLWKLNKCCIIFNCLYFFLIRMSSQFKYSARRLLPNIIVNIYYKNFIYIFILVWDMGVHRISTKKVLTEKYQMSSNFCRNKTSIQRSSLFKGQFLIHDPILMCFCLFTPEYWTVDTDLGKQKKKNLLWINTPGTKALLCLLNS